MLFKRVSLPHIAPSLPRQTRPHNCVQTVLAIALDVPIDTIEREAGTQGQMRIPDVVWLLNRLGLWAPVRAASLVADLWPGYYRRHGGRQLRGWGFRLPRGTETIGHAYLVWGTTVYDPSNGQQLPLTAATIRSEFDFMAVLPYAFTENAHVVQLRERARDCTMTRQTVGMEVFGGHDGVARGRGGNTQQRLSPMLAGASI